MRNEGDDPILQMSNEMNKTAQIDYEEPLFTPSMMRNPMEEADACISNQQSIRTTDQQQFLLTTQKVIEFTLAIVVVIILPIG